VPAAGFLSAFLVTCVGFGAETGLAVADFFAVFLAAVFFAAFFAVGFFAFLAFFTTCCFVFARFLAAEFVARRTFFAFRFLEFFLAAVATTDSFIP